MFNICVTDGSMVSGTDHAMVPMPNQGRVMFSQRLGATSVERVALQGRTPDAMAAVISDAYADRTLNFERLPQMNPYGKASFVGSRQHVGAGMMGPRIVTLLALDDDLIAVVTDFPNNLMRADGIRATDAQLDSHAAIVAAIRPLGTP